MNKSNHQPAWGEGTMLQGFIPHRLEIKDSPEYARFPLNVLFANTKVANGKFTLWEALYEPDLSSYQKSQDGNMARMAYYNRHNRAWSLVIVWQKTEGIEKYSAAKYAPGKEQPVLLADGLDWEGFFMQLTMPGPVNGETCGISRIG